MYDWFKGKCTVIARNKGASILIPGTELLLHVNMTAVLIHVNMNVI